MLEALFFSDLYRTAVCGREYMSLLLLLLLVVAVLVVLVVLAVLNGFARFTPNRHMLFAPLQPLPGRDFLHTKWQQFSQKLSFL